MDYIFTETQSIKDLKDILELQKINFKDNVSETLKFTEGYVSIKHDLALLQEMHKVHPHTIIKTVGGELIAYALVMDRSFSNSIGLLRPMFLRIDRLHGSQKGSYFVMGQVCIAAEHRRRGLFRKLYGALLKNTHSKYQHCYTEVNEKNTRSLQAHVAAGFKSVQHYEDKGEPWVIIYKKTDNT